MVEQIESNPDKVKICPYWRRYAVHIRDDKVRILALCGRAGNRGGQASEADLGKRVKKCPYFGNGGSQAYSSPSIIEIFEPDQQDIDFVALTPHKGLEGIEDLEGQWDSQLERFQQDCDSLE